MAGPEAARARLADARALSGGRFAAGVEAAGFPGEPPAARARLAALLLPGGSAQMPFSVARGLRTDGADITPCRTITINVPAGLPWKVG